MTKKKPIQLSDATLQPDDELYPMAEEILKMSQEEVEKFANRLLWLSKFLATVELKKALIRRFEMRLEAVEKIPGVKKSIQGQDGDNSNEELWPSLIT